VITLGVVPGQNVKKGDLLIEVERFDLREDLMKANLRRANLEMELNLMKRQYTDNSELQSIENRLKIKSLITEKDILLMEAREKTGLEAQSADLLKIDHTEKDSVYEVKLKALSEEIVMQQMRAKVQQEELRSDFASKQQALTAEISELQLSISLLEAEENVLKQFASFDGTVGNVYVELDEVAESFEKLISLYAKESTLIKAFASERDTNRLEEGSVVKVVSTNRSYSVLGHIEALGSRVTSYPQKINPQTGITAYGQEIFVRIDENSQFLNGEKVYVYQVKN
jgi:multidrug resistance efflux pump